MLLCRMGHCKFWWKSRRSKTVCQDSSCGCAISNRGASSAERFRMKKRSWLICKIALALLVAAPLTRGQSLWQEGAARNLVADKRATQVGDILSILIQESNTANRQNNTKTSKKSDIDARLQACFYSP